MEDVVSFVQEAEQQLSVLKGDEGLTVAQLEGWPKHRLDVLREAAGLFQELSYLSVKYQKWMLQQVHMSVSLFFSRILSSHSSGPCLLHHSSGLNLTPEGTASLCKL